MASFGEARDWAAGRRRAAHLAVEDDLRLPQRLDLLLAALATALVAALILVGAGLAWLQTAYGPFDGPALAPLQDERLTANLRSPQSRAFGPFVAADVLPDENAFYLLRAKGLLHRLDIRTGLWSETSNLASLPGVSGPFFDLSPACQAVGQATATCPGSAELFAYSAGGGLAMRSNGAWSVVIAETSFIGLSGKPVTNAQLTSAAVSTDGRWLMLAAGKEGLGLFDLSQRRWVAVPGAVQRSIFGASVEAPTALVAYEREFLVGTHSGLVTLQVGVDGTLTGIARLPKPNGEVVDIVSDFGEALLLARHTCTGGTCLLLGRYDGGTVTSLIEETVLFPSLTATSLSHALVSSDGGTIYALGSEGVYAYARKGRTWRQLLPGRATAFFEGPAIDGIFFATPGHANHLSRSGSLQNWAIPGGVMSFATDGQGNVLAQTDDNATYALDATPRLLVAGTAATQKLDELDRAVGAFGQVVAVSDLSLLLHDQAARTYLSQPIASLGRPGVLGPAAKLIGTPDYLWAMTGIEATAFSRDGATGQVQLAASGSLAEAPRILHPLGSNLIGVSTSGVPFVASVDGSAIAAQSLVGGPIAGGSDIVDAMLADGRVFLGRSARVDIYSESGRGAEPSIAFDIGESLAEMAMVDRQLLLLGEGGSLVPAGTKDRITGSTTSVISGSAAISDAMPIGMNAMLIAGPGGVSRYSISERRVTARFATGSGPRTRLSGTIGGLPVSYDGAEAWYGEQTLSMGGATVTAASVVGSTIYTVQRSAGVTFLVTNDASGDTLGASICYFRSPGPGDAQPLDVGQLPDGRSVTLVDNQLWLRDQARRRYAAFTIAADPVPSAARLSVTPGYVMVWWAGNAVIVPIGALAAPDSCRISPVDIRNQVTSLAESQLAVAGDSTAVWMLDAKGAVTVWRDGKTTAALAAPTDGPNGTSLTSADRDGQSLYFTDRNGIWVYDTKIRQWRHSAIVAGDAPFNHVDVWNSGSEMLLTARDEAGVYWGGAVGATTTTLTPLVQSDFEALPFSPAELLDVAELPDGTAAFLGRSEIGLVLDRNAEPPAFRGIPLPSARDDRHLAVQSGRLLVLDGDVAAPASLHILLTAAAGEQPGLMSFAPGQGETFQVKRNGGVLRQLPDGQVFDCPPAAGDLDPASCSSKAPAALRVDRTSIAKAFPLDRDHRRLIVTDTAGDVSEIDRTARTRTPLFDAAGSIAKAFAFGDGALLLSDARELLLARTDGPTSRQLASDLRILRGSGNLVLLQAGDSAVGLSTDATELRGAELFTALGGTIATDATIDALSLVGDGATAVMTTPKGPVLVSLTVRSPLYDDILSLPGGEALPPAPLQVVRTGDDWALRYPDRLLLVGRGRCDVVAPTPAPVPAPPAATPAADGAPAVVQAPPAVQPPPAVAPVDCLLVRASYSLPGGRSLNVQSVIDGAVTADGRPMLADACSDQPYNLGGDPQLVRPLTRTCTLSFPRDDAVVVQVGFRDIANASGEFVDRIDARSGQLDATSLTDQNGQMAMRFGDIVAGRFDGAVSRLEPASYDIGWMAWDRSARQFQFSNDAGQRFNLSPADAMPNGRFAFTAAGTPVIISGNEYLVANQFGLWRYSRKARGPLSWTPLPLPRAGVPARGRVFFDNGLSIGRGDTAATSISPAVQLAEGQLTVSADPVAQRVTATWSDGGSSVYDAFADTGFQFDRRLDLVADAGRPWLLTPIGMVDAADLSRSAPLPADIANVHSNGDLLTIRGEAYATDGSGNWQKLSADAWSRGPDPDRDRIVATEGPLEWRYAGGTLQVAAAGRSDLAQRSGLRFDVDVLNHAAVAADGVVLVLGDGMVRAAADLQGSVAPPPPLSAPPNALAELEVRPMADGRRIIVAVDGSGAIDSSWTGSGFAVPPAGDNPDVARLAAELSWLRVRFERGTPVTELLLEEPGAGSNWSPIAWAAGSPMPFDQLTAIQGVGGELAAGSPVGLQLLALSGSTIVSQRFVDLRTSPGDPYDPVRRIGNALVAGGSGAIVLGDRNCLELTTTAITRCTAPDPLGVEDLGGDPMWQWLREDGTISYFYRDSAGRQLTPLLPALTGGRFPHDSVDDAIACGGDVLQVWDGAITRLDNHGGIVNALTVSVMPGTALSLFCQQAAAPSSSEDPQGLPAGTYLLGSGRAWQWNGQGIAERADLLGALERRASGQVAFERGKLRVVNQDGVLFQYRRGKQWETLASDGFRLAIDNRDHLVFANGAFFAHTPQGFVSLDASTGGLNPDRVIIAPLTATADGCALDVAETADGRLSYVPAPASGAAVIVRCTDGALLTGSLDAASESRTFTPLGGADPFERRTIFDDKVAGIEMLGRRPGTPGSLSFTWRGEGNALSGGRFASDDLQALARIEPDTLDLVTGLGWVRQARRLLGDAGAVRPPNRSAEARAVTAIGADADPDNPDGKPPTRRLCLESAGGATSASWTADGRYTQSGNCAELLAFDGSYGYRPAADAGLVITGRSANGPSLVRDLTDGRFNDHRFTGSAVVAEIDGEPTIAVATGAQISFFAVATGRQRPGWAWPAGDAGALTNSRTGTIAVMSPRGLLQLDGAADESCPGFAQQPAEAAIGDRLRGLTLAGDHAYLRLRDGGNMLDVRIQCGLPQSWLLGDIADTAQRQRYLVNLEHWGRPGPLLFVDPSGSALTAHMINKSLVLRMNTPAVRYSRVVGQKFVFVTGDEVYGGEIDALLSAVQSHGAKP